MAERCTLPCRVVSVACVTAVVVLLLASLLRCLPAGHPARTVIVIATDGCDRDTDPAPCFSASPQRGDTARMYLKDARGRPNLSVVTGAAATRIAFEGKRAVGVEVRVVV